MNLTDARKLTSPRVALIAFILVSLIVFGCKGDPGASSGGPSHSSDDDFSLPTPTYPQRTIEFLVGAEPGTLDHDFAQAIASAYGAELGGETTVKSDSSNNGLAVIEGFKTASKDGHEFLVITGGHALANAAGDTTTHVANDFVALLTGTYVPSQIYASAGGDFASWDDVVSAGSAKVAVSGEDDIEGIMLSALAADLGIELTPVVVAEVSGQITAPGSGSADLVLTSIASARAAVASGDITPILTLWAERLPGSEDVPTALESGSTLEGLPRLQGIVIKKNTPQFLMDRIRTTLREAANGTEFGAYRTAAGLDTLTPPAGDAGLVFRDQVRMYQALLAR